VQPEEPWPSPIGSAQCDQDLRRRFSVWRRAGGGATGLSFTLPEKPARITTIAGESGSGKTTLANLILGFISLTSGDIIFKGTNLRDMNLRQRMDYRRQVQAIFQDPYAVYNPSTG